MKEISTVMAVSGHTATLGCTSEGCSSCAGNSFCNVKAQTYEAKIPKGLKLVPGEVVEVYLPPGKTILSGFMVLIVPLIMFLVGFVVTGFVMPESTEGVRAIGGFAGLIIGFGIGYLFGRINRLSYMPQIERRLEH